MFMSKDMFDDDNRSGGAMIIPPSRPQTAAVNSSQSTNLNSFDESGQALTPAMRKAKMEELRQQQIGKRKGRMLVPTTIARQERPMSASGINNTSAITTTNNSFTPINNQYQSNSSTFNSYNSNNNSSKPIMNSMMMNNNNNNNGLTMTRPTTSYNNGFSRSSAMSIIDNEESKREYDPHNNNNNSYSNGNGGKKAGDAMIQAGISPVFDPTFTKDNNNNNNNNSNNNSNYNSNNNSNNNSNSSTMNISQSPVPRASSVNNNLSIASLSPLALRLFLTSPTPPGQYHQCYIVRNKKGLTNRLYPHYECIYETGEKFLMIAKKKGKNKTSNYLISTDRDKTEKSDEEYIGKIRSNFVGTEFNLYDDGENPQHKQEGLRKTKRAELSCILYESNILGSKGPRKMTVIAPSVKTNKDGKYISNIHRPASNDVNDSLLQTYQTGSNSTNFIALVNKTPKWNDQVGAYVLNFNGRVTMASVKNFQLMIHKENEEESNGENSQNNSNHENNNNSDENGGDEERPVLQFGRVGKDTFTMDFGFPLSPLQAFGICLSSFDSKLACE